MKRIKAQVLREFGDHGADTLERYFVQIEYTAFWCIRMLRHAEGIEAVIPEGVEDAVIVRLGINELHQIKTRDESQGPWTNAEVLPILCQQYQRRNAFLGQCHFHFVSNQMADAKTSLGPRSLGPLYPLKHLLEIKHDGQAYKVEEQQELQRFEGIFVPRIRDGLVKDYHDNIDDATALELLHNTWIETDSSRLRNADNITELDSAFRELYPDLPAYTLSELSEIYDRLVLLVFVRAQDIANSFISKKAQDIANSL